MKLVLFDWGGVLCQEMFNTRVAERFGIPPEDLIKKAHRAGWLAAATGKIDEDEYWSNMAAELGAEVSEVKKMAFEDIVFNEKVFELAKRVKEKGHRVAILTNNLKDWFEAQAVGRIEHFEKVFNSAEMGTRKPEVQMYLAPLNHFEFLPGDTYLIDDKTRNTIAAEAIGIKTFLFEDENKLETDLTKAGLI